MESINNLTRMAHAPDGEHPASRASATRTSHVVAKRIANLIDLAAHLWYL